MESIYSCGTSSSSHTYGNVMLVIKNLILSKFPYNYFKYVNLSTTMGFKNVKDQLGSNTDIEITKRVNPIIIIKPAINPPDNDTFLYGTPMTKNIDNLEIGMSQKYLLPLLNSKEDQFRLTYKLNRDKIEFDVSIRVESLHQQLDVYKDMQNYMLWDRPFFHPASLETMIPRPMIDYIGKLSNIDISEDHNVPVILRYLNKISKYPITYKIRNSTSRDEYFMYYTQKLLVTFTDLSPESGNKRNMADDYHEITFRATVEFNLPGTFVLIGDKDRKFGGFKFDLVVTNETRTNRDFFPIFTLDNLYNDYNTLTDGFKSLTNFIIKTEEENDGREDSMNIESMFDNSYVYLIKDTKRLNVPIETLFRIKIYKDKDEIVENKDWTMDWNTFDLTILKSDFEATYRVIIYVNLLHANERVLELDEKMRFDKTKVYE